MVGVDEGSGDVVGVDTGGRAERMDDSVADPGRLQTEEGMSASHNIDDRTFTQLYLSQPCWKRSSSSLMSLFSMTFLTTSPMYWWTVSGAQSLGGGRSICEDSSTLL